MYRITGNDYLCSRLPTKKVLNSHITGPLWGESTGKRYFLHQGAVMRKTFHVISSFIPCSVPILVSDWLKNRNRTWHNGIVYTELGVVGLDWDEQLIVSYVCRIDTWSCHVDRWRYFWRHKSYQRLVVSLKFSVNTSRFQTPFNTLNEFKRFSMGWIHHSLFASADTWIYPHLAPQCRAWYCDAACG